MTAVTEYLDAKGIDYEILAHPRAFTGIQEALALGIEADEVLKTVVLDTDHGHVLAVMPGSRRLDMDAVRHAVGDAHAALATEDEMSRDYMGLELGSMPPLGGLLEAETYVDPQVRDHETVLFAAGTQTESVRVRTEELFAKEPAHFVDLTKEE